MDMTYPSWTYQGRIFNDITDFPKDTYGFIYEVVHQPSGMKYLGKKVLYFNRTLPPLKGQKRKRRSLKESDWQSYYGSSETVKELVENTGEWRFQRKILRLCTTQGEMSYYETKEQIDREVLFKPDEYYNAFIGCKIHRSHVLKKK